MGKIFKSDTKWAEVEKELFYQFCKDKCIIIDMHRGDFDYYSNATRMSIAKRNRKTKEYYILFNALAEYTPSKN